MAKPSKYQTHVAPYLDKIAAWITAGATEKEIADNLHITKSTFALYLKRGRDGEQPYSDLSELYARAIQEPNENVEAALYNLAIGYTVDLQKTFKIKEVIYDPDTGKRVKEIEKLVQGIDQQHVPANVQAVQFYLANRMPEKWKYKPEPEKGNDEGGETGVVVLPPVMDNPGQPETEDAP